MGAGFGKKGITVIELMTVIVIIGILLAIAIPTFARFRADSKLRGTALLLYGDLNFAKIKAMETGVSHTVIFGQQIENTTYTYVVIKDDDVDCEYDSGEDIVKKVLFTDTYKGISIQNTTLPNNDDGLPAVRFNNKGISKNNTGGFGAGTITLQENTYNNTKDVVISSLGRVKIQ